MAISVKYLVEELGIEKEVAEKIFAERGKEIAAEKTKREELEIALGETDKSLAKITEELNTLKETNADANEWKTKFEKLEKEIAEKEAQAAADKEAKEKADNIANRFKAVLGEMKKEFSHSAIEADYLKKFGEALDVEENKSKSDEDIFHALTKDDASAFKGVTAFKLEGGADKGFGGDSGIDLGNLDMADYIKARNEMKG